MSFHWITSLENWLGSAAHPPGADELVFASPAGLRMIELFEGVRLEAYQDIRGIWTIGTGHTSNAPSGIKVFPGMTITRAQNDALFAMDIAPYQTALNVDLTRTPKQHEYDAMLSLEYNIGMAGMKKSSVVRDFNAGKSVHEIAADFLKWSKPAVLLKRREKEAFLFATGTYPS